MHNKVQELIKKGGIDAFLLINSSAYKKDPNIPYFSAIDMEYCIFLGAKTSRLYVPGFEYERAKKEAQVPVSAFVKKKRAIDQLAAIINRKKIKRLGVNKDVLTINEYKIIKKKLPRVRFIDISKTLNCLRAEKTESEIELIKILCKKTDQIISSCIKNFSAFKTEQDAADFLTRETTNAGAELAFPPIIASGKGAGEPHHNPTGTIKKGFCIMDFGIRKNGYCTDITRTIHIGKATDKDRKLYSFLATIQAELITEVKPGIKASILYRKAIEKLSDKAEYFTHGLGHGIGIMVHELPNITPDSKDLLKPGMIFTIEPGIYFPTKGIRIEDDVLVTKKDFEVLTKTTKKLIEV